MVLSTQAVVHLMKLPNLDIWVTEQGPPQVTDLIRHGVPDGVFSLFPSLKGLNLRGEAALGWLTLFETTKDRTPPWIVACDGLVAITYYHHALPIDSSLTSRFLPFVDLSDLRIMMGCLFRPCASRFTDQDVERLAIALPRLEILKLGDRPCSADTCPTTVRSLLSLSIHCTKLEYLNIHFRMANLRADVLGMLAYAYSQGLHSKPKCALKTLVAGGMPIRLSDYDPGLVSIGVLMIFPSLTEFDARGGSPAWSRVGTLVKALGQVRDTAALTEVFMTRLNEARELAEKGIPTCSAVRSHF